MKPDLNSRLPLFELLILIVMGILIWAAFRLYNEQGLIEGQRERVKALTAESNRLILEAAASQQVYTNLQQAFKGELSPEQTNRMENMLKLAETLQIKEEYLSIAKDLTSRFGELHTTLGEGLKRRPRALTNDFWRQRREMDDWLNKEKSSVELGHFPARSQKLKERIDQERLASTNGPVSITKDLGSLLTEITLTYSNYMADAELVVRNATKRLDLAQARFEQAGKSAKELSDLAAQARADGKAVENFLGSQWQSESNERIWRQERALTLLSNSPSPLEFAQRAALSDQTNSSILSSAEGPSPSLGPALYGLLLALGVLGLFLLVALYRGMVVTPLRLKLVQRDTIIEQQTKLASFQKLALILADEIRNPLTAISARLWTLQKNLEPGSDGHKDAADIGSQINGLDQVVKHFLELAGPAEPSRILLNAREALQEVWDLMAEQFKQQSIECKIECEQNVQFLADPPQLRQVLINLLKNAAESLNHSGTITLRARKSRRNFKGEPCQAAVIEVQDTGPGIPPENRGRIFDPFFTTKQGRPGLGLAIAGRIVTNHEGILEFESQPGKGAIFRIVLRAR